MQINHTYIVNWFGRMRHKIKLPPRDMLMVILKAAFRSITQQSGIAGFFLQNVFIFPAVLKYKYIVLLLKYAN